MKIKDRLSENRVNISFEVFPPKQMPDTEKYWKQQKRLRFKAFLYQCDLWTGGGTSKNTVKIASHIQNDLGVASLAHLTCASSTKEEVRQVIEQLKEQGIQNNTGTSRRYPKRWSFSDSQPL